MQGKEYSLSKKSRIFLPITLVRRDTSRKDIHSGDKVVPGHKKIVHLSTDENENNNPYNLGIGSTVQHFEQYGVIKWIGTLFGDKKIYAKVEMVKLFVYSLI